MTDIDKNDIPIYILNRDRLIPVMGLVESLLTRDYTNVTIIDNDSTYPPLLEWYETVDVTVYHTPDNIIKDNSALSRLAEAGIEPFASDLRDKWCVWTDSDIVPLDTVPHDFLNDMIHFGEVCGASKIGLGMKLDDIPDHYALKEFFVNYELGFWNCHYTEVDGIKLFHAPIDTSFAIHRPGVSTGWTAGGAAVRVGNPYVARHMPWYYDTFNLPDDEAYYMEHFDPAIGYGCSAKIKTIIDERNATNG